jgi:hypothetical protein
MKIQRNVVRWGSFLLMGLALTLTCAAQQKSGPASAGLILKEDTEVPLKFAQDLSSKDASEGDSVSFILAEDLIVDGTVVVKAGAKAIGEVSNAKKAGMMGKGGELNIKLDHLTAGNVRVKIRGSRGREGESKLGTAVVLTVLFGPVGLVKHGKNIDIKEGAAMKAFVAENATFPVAP